MGPEKPDRLRVSGGGRSSGEEVFDKVDLQMMRKTAAEVVSREDVRCLIGWRRGSYGYRIAPAFIEEPAGTDELIFSPLCAANLVTYLTLAEKLPLPRGQEPDPRKVALLVKGCDSRAVVQLLVEKGIDREKILVLGCPCPGMVDLDKLRQEYPETAAPAELCWHPQGFLLLEEDGEKILPREKFLAEKCRLCRYPNPVLADIMLGEPVQPWEITVDIGVAAVEKKSPAERWAYWRDEFSRCLRCYACRNACPLCYCEDCILDRLNPTWVNRAVNFSENTAFNLARAFHLAGRCVECGECERVCPARLPLGRLNRKLAGVVREQYGFEAGRDTEGKAFHAAYCPDDPEDFVL